MTALDAEQVAKELSDAYADEYVHGQKDLIFAARGALRRWPGGAPEIVKMFVDVLEVGVIAIEKRTEERKLSK